MEFGDDGLTEPFVQPETVEAIEYVSIEPFRFVKPYHFTFKCTAKGRWHGRKLIDVFAQEFKHWSRDVLGKRILDGDILVNGNKIPIDYVVRDHNVIEHTIMRTESPVYDRPIITLGETDDFIAFLKPASLPVHPTGGYYYNSMCKQIHGRYHLVHRLDRVTSGIIVMAKNKAGAQRFSEMLTKSQIHKKYLARVVGVFPDGEVKCDFPIRNGSKDRAIKECGTGGKESLTIFRRLSTNGKESVVECVPVTGRTHQIRVHLSALGFHITNDGTYGGEAHNLTTKERSAITKAEKDGMWPPDTFLTKENDPSLTFEIFLHSFHYQSAEFDFRAPMPEWADLNKPFPEEENVISWWRKITGSCITE
jgi:tRNA pseudouridine synthase 9